MSSEVRESILIALQFVEKYLPEVTTMVLDGADVDEAAKTLHRRMRMRLPVPSIFCVLRILFRVQGFLAGTSAMLEADPDAGAKLPASTNHLDHTVKKLYRRVSADIDRFMAASADWKEIEWNPYAGVAQFLETIVKYNSHVFFGVSFYAEEEAEEG